jgi:hypothetical protein
MKVKQVARPKPEPIVTEARETKTYRIPVQNWYALLDRIEKIARKANKLGFAPIEVKKIGEETKTWNETDTVQRSQVYYIAELTGETPRINGFSLVATLSHVALDDGTRENILMVVPGENVPEKYRKVGAEVCDHCHTRRARNENFLIRNDQGIYKVVGRNCLADFLGSKNPHQVASYMEAMISVAKELGEGEDDDYVRGSGGGKTKFHVPTIVAHAVACVNKWGWLSIGKAREMVDATPTSNRVSFNAFELNTSGHRNRCNEWCVRNNHVDVTSEDHAKAAQIIEWAREWTQEQIDQAWAKGSEVSEYIVNLNVVVRLGWIEPKFLGILVSVVGVEQRERERQAQRAEEDRRRREEAEKGAKGNLEFVGNIGDKITLKLRVVSQREIASDWGGSTLYTFVDPETGNQFVTFHSGREVLEDGETYTIRATIKGHKEFRGIPQTTLTRIRAT